MGGVRLTECASPQHCCCAHFWTFFYGTCKERSPRRSIFLRVLKSLTSTRYRSSPEEERSITENSLVV